MFKATSLRSDCRSACLGELVVRTDHRKAFQPPAQVLRYARVEQESKLAEFEEPGIPALAG